LDVLVLFIGSTLFRVLFRSGRLLKRSILPRIRSHALIPCCQEIRGVHYTICYISSFSKISLSRPTSRNPDPLGVEPAREANVTAKIQKLFWLLQHFEENFFHPRRNRGLFHGNSLAPFPRLRLQRERFYSIPTKFISYFLVLRNVTPLLANNLEEKKNLDTSTNFPSTTSRQESIEVEKTPT